jgi:HD-like signal output (HDOD) protein
VGASATLPPIVIDPAMFLKDHSTLPALPEVVSQIQSIIRDDDVAIEKVAGLISSDPALLAQTLKVVNSAYYGLPWEVTKAQVAISFLGLNEVHRMVLSLSVINTLSIVDKKEELASFWHHSVYTAICTKHLVNRYSPGVNLEELWSAAVLHDIGKLVCLKLFPQHYRAVKACAREQGCLFSEAERALGVPASALLGTLLADRWRLPEKVKEACERHTLHDLVAPDADTPLTPIQRIIALGNLLTVLTTEWLSEDKRLEMADAVVKELRCPDKEIEHLLEEIEGLRSDVEGLMGQFR